MFKKYLIGLYTLGALCLLGIPQISNAKSYYHPEIDFKIQINKDTTFEVLETQTFYFEGEYHQGWRRIPFNKFSDISDMTVMDAQTGQFYTYSKSKLNKLDPTSWGKYTTYIQKGEQYIEWYFNAINEVRTFTLGYKIHGGIAFYEDHDELYWNLITDYDVDIGKISVYVYLPDGTQTIDQLKSSIYVAGLPNDSTSIKRIIDNKTFYFEATEALPNAKVTIAPGWPKGIVDQKAFWADFLRIYTLSIISALIILATLIMALIYWLNERRQKNRGTIIPQYEPPRNINPAMAELVMKEHISSKTWASTIIDLAIRGHIKITEEKTGFSDTIIKSLPMFAPFILFAIAIIIFAINKIELFVVIPIFIIFIIPLIISLIKNGLSKKDYILEQVHISDELFRKPTDPESGKNKKLLPFEKKLMHTIFYNGDKFSTRELQKEPNQVKMAFQLSMREAQKELLIDTDNITGAYEKTLANERKKQNFVTFIGGGIFLILIFVGTNKASAQLIFFAISLLVPFCTYLLLKYDARLNKQGLLLREEILGFKMYLETAERYRLQNLTPETFEKYLPYAMVFGVEKKWAKAFANMDVPQPAWYAGVGVGHSGSFASSGFSASSFTSSFSASFTSSMASASGSGASGGGGGAGGGGGGGGGGAS